ncbi:MAG: polyprenyl synthetase family protein [Bacteroidota bacterium]
MFIEEIVNSYISNTVETYPKMHTSEELYKIYQDTFSTDHFNFEPKGLYEPVKHIMSIPGKRIRPMLCLMSCEMFGGNIKDALYASFAMEVFHNFTLVHDDIMDKADIRRGHPTVHKVFGTNAGILAGDAMLSYAYKYLCMTPASTLVDVLDVFNKTSIEIYEGQQLDVDFETRLDVSEEEYIKMIEYKTSVLLACSLKVGAIIGGASKEDQERIYNFGLYLGLSFQIKDDLLDTFGEQAKVGKRIGGDILNNKKTFLLINALKKASAEDKEHLLHLMDEPNEDKKIAEVKEIFNLYHIESYTQERIEKYYQDSITYLDAISADESSKSVVRQLAEKIHGRDY